MLFIEKFLPKKTELDKAFFAGKIAGEDDGKWFDNPYDMKNEFELWETWEKGYVKGLPVYM